MKRFVLFYGSAYYPDGGVQDYAGAFDTLEQAQSAVPDKTHWAHVAEITESGLKFVSRIGSNYCQDDLRHWTQEAHELETREPRSESGT